MIYLTRATDTTEPTEEIAMNTVPRANAILTNGQGEHMMARYDDATDTWDIALPCGQTATGVRNSSIQLRLATQGWKVCS